MALADSQLIEGRWFHRWTGRIGAKEDVRLTVRESRENAATAPRRAGRRSRARPGPCRLARHDIGVSPRVTTPAPGTLLDALAELDAQYAGRESEVAPEEWQQYQEERARLKASLEAALAAGEVRPVDCCSTTN